MRTLLIVLLLSLAIAHGQAPIERRPPIAAADPKLPANPDASWQNFMQHWAASKGTELRVETSEGVLRCHLKTITAMTLECNQLLAARILYPIPSGHLQFPRSYVDEVRVGGREKSTTLGALLGFGAGLSLAATHGGINAGAVLGSIGTGVIGGFIGHILPARGHVVYRQQPSPNRSLPSTP